MNFDLDDLRNCLALEPVGPDVTEGANLDVGYHRVFGGQILAQVLATAAHASPDKSVKSLSVLFPREGDAAKPMRYRTTKLHDGRTFGTTEVIAAQAADANGTGSQSQKVPSDRSSVEDARVIAAAVVSMHIDEDGLRRSDAPPEVGRPEDATTMDLPMVPWEVRVVGGVDLAYRGVGPAHLEMWMRAPALGDARWLHQALLAHATDLTLIGTALRPFDGFSQADSMSALHTAVTSHSLWFHQPFRLDDWLLVTQHSPVVAHGRAFGRGDVFNTNGDLVASFAQESMIRQL